MAQQQVSAVTLDVLHDGAARALISSNELEVLHAGNANIVSTGIAMEVLRTVERTSTPANRRIVMMME